jgi:hypothetical protein
MWRSPLLPLLVIGLGLACQSSASIAPNHPSGPDDRAHASVDKGRLPARLRRLSNSEYAQTLSHVVGFRVTLPESFPEDVLEKGFSSNGGQGVDPLYVAEAQALARELAARAARERFSELVPCVPESSGCAERFVTAFARRAYRRPARAAEIAAGLKLFEAAALQGGFVGGVEQVVATLLVSPELLYVSEVGVPASSGMRRLTSEEAASVLGYMLTGGPPDDALVDAGTEGHLLVAERRAEHAWRLLGQSQTRFQFRRFVREWLGLDALESLTKPVADDRQLRLGLLAETDAFVDEVFMYEGASLDKLLAANFTVIPASLRAFEGLPPATQGNHYGRVPLDGSARLGLLQQPSFLAVHAHESQTAPVLRGKAILERFLCVELPRPTELGLQVTFPPPDPRLTTRERHAQHSQDATCRSCHRTIDALGYTFENFDFVGRVRQEENRRPIDTRTDYDGPEGPMMFRDSRDVSRWLAENARAHECFARQAFRFFTGQGDAALESAFLAERRRLPEAERRNLFATLVAFIQSPVFMERAVKGTDL